MTIRLTKNRISASVVVRLISLEKIPTLVVIKVTIVDATNDE
jgi:hypothetical protein